MKTTLNIDDKLLAEAMNCTGSKEKTTVVHMGLESLIKDAAMKRLVALGGTMRKAKAAPRKRRILAVSRRRSG